MMRKFFLATIIFACCDSYAQSYSELMNEAEREKTARADISLEDHVQAALDHFAKTAPKFHSDCLRVWKNFKKGIDPHYSYRSWGIRFIMWLKQERNVTFASQSQVGDVFAILYKKGLISKHAVLVLTANVWSYLVYREGIPDIDKQDRSRNNNRVEIIT